MLKDIVSDLFDGRNRSSKAVAEALGVTVQTAAVILADLGYVIDHTGSTSGKVYFRPA